MLMVLLIVMTIAQQSFPYFHEFDQSCIYYNIADLLFGHYHNCSFIIVFVYNYVFVIVYWGYFVVDIIISLQMNSFS